MQKKGFNVKIMAEIAILAALGYALDFLQGTITGSLFPNGGSIGIAMCVVFIIAFRHGCIPAILTGLIMGLLDLMDGFYAISDAWYKVFAQVALDYWMAYPLAGLAGLFYKKIHHSSKKAQVQFIMIACFVGSFAKFLAHFLSGVIFWPNSDQVGESVIFSILYNGSYMLPCFILCTIVLVLINYKQESLLNFDNGGVAK